MNIQEFEAGLPRYIAEQRWFRSKTRTIQKATIADLIPLPVPKSSIAIVRIEYSDGGEDFYQLPLMESGEALSDPDFRQLFVDAVAHGVSFEGRSGRLTASKTKDFQPPKVESFVSRAEQSNTSVIYGDQFILKFFRKIEAGINPDIEIGGFLTKREFKNTPAVLGVFEYRSKHEEEAYSTAILQEFVANRGDAWKYTLDSLAGYFKDPANSEYFDSAELLGRRTGEMHSALADPEGGDDFAPEPSTKEEMEKLRAEMLHQADITFDVLRQKSPDSALLQREDSIRQRFDWLTSNNPSAMRIRYHGDYHLGQVLYTGSDFMIIDFEGEPARPLSERRGKTFAMRDVAGMLRSFDYAANMAAPSKEAEPAATEWTSRVTEAFLRSYYDSAAGQCFIPAPEDRKPLLDAFLLQKALYEVAYELNNRPDWVNVPLRGILNLIN